VQRIAFQLRIKADRIEEYDEAHRHVWPELLQEMERFGIRDYSIFRRGQQLFLTMHVHDFEEVAVRLADSDVNRQWQLKMAPLLEEVPGLESGEQFAMMREVFFMRGRTLRGDNEGSRRKTD